MTDSIITEAAVEAAVREYLSRQIGFHPSPPVWADEKERRETRSNSEAAE